MFKTRSMWAVTQSDWGFFVFLCCWHFLLDLYGHALTLCGHFSSLGVLHGLCSLFSHLSSLCSHCFILHGHFCLVVIFSLFLVISCFVLLGQLVCGWFFFVFYLNFAPMWDFFCLFEVTLSFLWSFRVSVITFLKLCVICLFVVILYVTIFFFCLFEPFISFQTFF